MKQYLKIGAVFALAVGLSALVSSGDARSPDVIDAAGIFVLFLGFGWALTEFSNGTRLASFALMLIVGFVLHPILSTLASEIDVLVTICLYLAAIILRSGGDEVERRHFGKIVWPTLSIAIAGYLVKFCVIFMFMRLIGIDGRTAALIAAITGSTDPAALIPTLKTVKFRPEHRRLVDIAVAESAFNDVVGALFTGRIIALILNSIDVSSLGNIFQGVAEPHSLSHLGKDVLVGGAVGCVGWYLMYRYQKYKSLVPETAHDYAAILSVTFSTYWVADNLGGSGLLAAFMMALFADYNHGNLLFKKTLAVTETQIDSIAKPVIFMMGGVFVGIGELWQNALVGFAISMVFIFVARPLSVLVSIGPFVLKKKMTWREMCFLFIVNETGVIPIVLAVVAVKSFPHLDTLIPLVGWVVIWTLTLLPAITPWWARTLGLTEVEEHERTQTETTPLGERTYGFLDDWRNFSFRLRGGIDRLMPKK